MNKTAIALLLLATLALVPVASADSPITNVENVVTAVSTCIRVDPSQIPPVGIDPPTCLP